MRSLRLLKQGVWYGVRTRINNGEPLFRRCDALVLFAGVFHEAEARFGFEVRCLCLEDDWLVFYLKPKDGFELPAIMKWLKQTFAVRFNRRDGRTGHVWGDRYESWVLKGEPPEPEDDAAGDDAASSVSVRGANLAGTGLRGGWKTGVRPHGGWNTRVRPHVGKPVEKALFSHLFPHPTPPPPG
jgi:hypothetical protein